MNLRSSTEHLAGSLIRAEAGRKGEAAGRAGPGLTVALSRQVGALGTTVAREVGGRLGWPVYDHEILERIAREMKVNVRVLERIDERPSRALREFIEFFSAAPQASEPAYVHHLVKTLQALGAQGSCVIVGRGAAQVLPEATALRVRLVAALEDRVAVIRQMMGGTRDEAARHVEATERERVRFVKDHFQKDPTAAENYDLVLNTSRFTAPECAELIIDAVRRLQARAQA